MRIVKSIHSRLQSSSAQAYFNAKGRQMRDTQRYDQDVGKRRRFKLSGQVLMKDRAPQGKFADRWIGRIVVVKIDSGGMYHAEDRNTKHLQGAINGGLSIPFINHKYRVPDV